MVRKASGSEPTMVLQLRDAIRDSGKKLTELSEKSGVDAGRLSRFVRGQRDINFDAAARICEALGITFNVPDWPDLAEVAEPPKRKPVAKPAKRRGK
jgi:transcriptional regulator with XRE-family HTH domain